LCAFALTINGDNGNNRLDGRPYGLSDDQIYAFGGEDTLLGWDGNDYLDGGAGNDFLYGEAGNDSLWGGSGVDTMSGGSGNDIYVVDNPSDVVTESASQGLDTVQSFLNSYTLGANVENLELFENSPAINGTGNNLDNFIYGNAANNSFFGQAGNDALYSRNGNDYLNGGDGNDYLDGGAGNDFLYGEAGNDSLWGGSGADAMSGGSGNDIYVVDHLSDVVTENTSQGIDTVQSFLNSYTLGANVENLELFENSPAINGTGNALNNTIIGNSGNNNLWGNGGSDSLSGGAGNDRLNGYGYSGSSEYDTLTGGVGADTFELGNIFDSYYDSNGLYTGDGYAIITDFKYQEGDKLQLKGNASLYTESDVNWGIGTPAFDTAIYKSGDLIALLQDVSGSNFILSLDSVFV
jgi:Ca2+-binding RTX toxin-like protein